MKTHSYPVCRFTFRTYNIDIVIEDVVATKHCSHWQVKFKRGEQFIEMIIPKCDDPLFYLHKFFLNTLEPMKPTI